MSFPIYENIPFSSIKEKIKENFVMLVTATETETLNLHSNLKPLPGSNSIYKIHKGKQTYFVGIFGIYCVVHVQSGMGSTSRNASIITISEAIVAFSPKIVVMIGIAFGVNKRKQAIGDVLVSETILPYELIRNGKETIYRSGHAYAHQLLVNRFTNGFEWDYTLPSGEKAKIIPANLLSGEELIDNIARRKELTKAFPIANGGEMEGVGVFAACDTKAAWILVKGICDYADGKKGKNKDYNQLIAIKSAISASQLLFSAPYSFDGLDIQPLNLEANKTSDKINLTNSNDVLFEYYNNSYEKHYISRSLDNIFSKTLSNYSIWLYGKSGTGKTNLAIRNLLFNKKEYIQVNLYGCINNGIDSFMKEIVNEVADFLDEAITINVDSNFNTYIKEFYRILRKCYSNKEVYILLEEVPIGQKNEYAAFTQSLIQMLNAKISYPELNNVKIVLSSIENPSSYIKDFQTRITQTVKFIELKYWSANEINELNKTIQLELNINLELKINETLLVKSKGCPRFIKAFYRNLISIYEYEKDHITIALNETVREFYYLQDE